MPKGAKSSASSGTRKKHAKKSNKDDTDVDTAPATQKPRQRGEKKLSKAQKKALPKVKQYIPPPKPPAPPIPDPLDGQGLARTLPADLVVVLRRLGKKDEVTRRKGLEELREWIGGLKEGDEVEREMKETDLLAAVPVWLHNLASLLQSPFHRSLALQLQSELLAIPSIRTSILDSLSWGLLPGTQNRDVLGSWFVAALEDGRRSGVSKTWEDSTTWAPEAGQSGQTNIREYLTSLIEYLSLSILDPSSLHDDIHPAPVSSTPSVPAPTAKKGGKQKIAVPTALVQSAEFVPEDDTANVERLARYRIGGLIGLARLLQDISKNGITPPTELFDLIRHPLLWSALSPKAQEDSANIGVEQPAIRKAVYSLLDTMIETQPEEVGRQETVEMLSTAVLGSCWVEKDASVWQQAGQAVVKFLSKYRESWMIASKADNDVAEQDDQSRNGEEADEGEGDDQDGSDEETGGETADEEFPGSTQAVVSAPQHPKPFADFLGWVSTICPLIPHLTYPLLLVIVSTLPDVLLPLEAGPSDPLQSFFSHLWSPIDARLLSSHSMPNQVSAFQAFYQDAVDCTVFLIGRASRRDGGKETAEWLVREQMGDRAWIEGVLEMGAKGGRRRGQVMANEFEADIFGKALGRIATSDPALIDIAMPLICDSVSTRCYAFEDGRLSKSSTSLLPRCLAIVTAVRGANENQAILTGLSRLVSEIAAKATGQLQDALSMVASTAPIFAEIVLTALSSFAGDVTGNVKQDLAKTLQTDLAALVAVLPPQTIVRLLKSTAEAVPGDKAALSSALWNAIDSSSLDRSCRFALSAQLAGSSNTTLNRDGALDHIAVEATQSALLAGPGVEVARSAVKQSAALSSDALQTVLALVCTSIHDQVDDLLSGSEESTVPTPALEILASYAESHPDDLTQSDILLQAVVAVHHLVFLLPRNSLETFQAPEAALAIWKTVGRMTTENQTKIGEQVSHALADMLGQVKCLVEPAVLVDVALSSQIGKQQTTASGILQSLLPSSAVIDRSMSVHTSSDPHPGLAIVDELVPCTQNLPGNSSSAYDAQGRSMAARYAEATLCILRADRQLAQTQPQMLHTVLSTAVFARDTLDIPTGSRGFFAPTTQRSMLKDLVREVDGTLSFALAAVDDAAVPWHQTAVGALAIKNPSEPKDFLQSLLVDLKVDIMENDSDVGARVMRDVLSRHFRQSGAGEKEAEVWLAYGMTMIERSTSLCIAIILAIKPLLLDSERFQTAQNRLASYLTTIKPSQANAQGIPALRRLLASAPPADAPSVFLPQQRAIFVLRHVISWLTSDEADDFDESMEVYVAQLYTALAPVVQDVDGAHWDGIFDLIESGLENATMGDTSTHCLLYNCLLLLQQVRDLSTTNKALRALWVGRDVQLGLVLKLFLQCREANTTPLQLIQNALLDLLQDVSDKAIAAADLGQLCDLLRLSSSTSVQSTAYRILSRVIKNRTVELVLEVEASVAEASEGHASREIALPAGLVTIVDEGKAIDWQSEIGVSSVLAQLLGWMAVLDHFEDASRTLRWAYLDQINSTKLIDECLLPMLFAILGVTEVGAWNFPSSSFAVDEFYPDLLEPEDLPDLAPLASHLFYRSLITLPSAMRTFYESLKDRQLSMSMLNFTARHYSPVIIRHEFSALRQPSAMAQLTEEGLNIRIAQGGGSTIAAGTGSAEAIASYVVDEQPMEIGIRLPAEFPLRGVEIRDLKRVGVPENKWRGWLMSVQQTITSRNGLILEALTVFKKNVSLHFEGVVECAICYSIISLTDRTLPTKPCRTCKNRFHASCLFKWFNSSHSSSCPMCRALF